MSRFAKTMHVLAVRELAPSLAFYRDVLGLAEIHVEPRLAVLGSGAFRVFIGECDGIVDPRDLGDHRLFARVSVDGLDAFHAQVRERWPQLTAPQDKPWGLREFVVTSPDGHVLIFQEEIVRP